MSVGTLTADLTALTRQWRTDAARADFLSEKRPHPADVMLSARAQALSDCASALEAAVSTEPSDALAVAQDRTLAVLSSLAEAVGSGNIAGARMLAGDDLSRCLDELGLIADAEIAERIRNG
jgi:hypothetical protein